MTDTVRRILANYESDNPGTKANLARILLQGKLGGTGKMVILPVDQGLEHGPARSFASNPPAYDPHYHYQLAIDNGLNAFAAPIGMIEAGADHFAGRIPTILKVNSSNSLVPSGQPYDQAFTATVQDAVRLGCSAIGLTIYPGSSMGLRMIEQAQAMIAEAKAHGLVAVVWSYPRGEDLSKLGETSLDVCGYATHIAALIGAHIIKVKLPSDEYEQKDVDQLYERAGMDYSVLSNRVKHVMQCALNGRRLVVFSGGGKKGTNSVFDDAKAIMAGGGNGSIIGRNSLQRSKAEAGEMLQKVIGIYGGDAG